MSRESGEKHGDSVGDGDLGDGAHGHVEGDGDPHHEGTERVDDAVLNDFKETLDTSHDDSSERQETDISKGGGDSTDDPSEAESKHDDSAASTERDSGDHGLEQCIAEYQSTLNDPTVSNETASETSHPEECGAKGENYDQRGDEVQENSKCEPDIGPPREEQAVTNGEKFGRESQTSDNQDGAPEFARSAEAFSTESQQPINSVEGFIHSQETSREIPEAVDLSTVYVYDARVVGAGELVSDWRNDGGLTQYELADNLGCDQSLISCWESDKSFIPLEQLQQMAQMIGTDLDHSLRELQASNHDVNIEWKGEHYSLDSFIESIQSPQATLNYSEAQQTYFLELNPMADVEFHRRDIITVLAEHDGVQTIAELTACKGVRANIRAGVVERIGIEVGDEVGIHALNVRGHEDTPWESTVQVPTDTKGEGTSIHLSEELEQIGFRVVEGDHVRLVVQTNRGEGLALGTIEDGAIRLDETIATELLGGEEVKSLTVNIGSIVVSHTSFVGEVELPVAIDGGVHIGGLLTREGFTSLRGGESLRADVVAQGGGLDPRDEHRKEMRIDIGSHEIFPPYSGTQNGTSFHMNLENIVVLNSQDSETKYSPAIEGSYTRLEKSIMGSELFDALTQHLGAETLYQVESPYQRGIDRIIELNGNIIIVEEKAEHAFGMSWRSTSTLAQVAGYRNSFEELVERNRDLSDKLQGREPNGIEIWTTARVPTDESGQIDTNRIHLFDSCLNRNLREGEQATLRIHYLGSDGEEHVRQLSDVEYSVSATENKEIVFSLSAESLVPAPSDEEREMTDRLEIKVRHHDHVEAACGNSELFDDVAREMFTETMHMIERRAS